MSHFEQIPTNQPENKPEQAEKNKQEQGKEQTPEEILEILNIAIEKESKVKLSVLDLNGKTLREGIAIPEGFEENVIWITTEDGLGMSIEASRIRKAELLLGEKEEK